MTRQSFLEPNIASLEARGLISARSAAALRESAAKPSRMKPEPDGGWLFEDPSCGVRQRLHSRIDPDGEATRLAQSWLASCPGGRVGKLVVVIGAAGLLHVKALAAILPQGTTLLVIEPLPEILAASLARWSLEELEKPGVELRFASHSDYPKLMEEFRLLLRGMERLDISVFAHPASTRLAPELHKLLDSGLAERLRLERSNRDTLLRFSSEWILNSLANLPSALDATPVGALAGIFEGCAAVVAGAGPSLDSAIPHIKAARSSFVLIAAGTALKPLLAAGIEADFAVSVDSDPKTLRQFEGVEAPPGMALACALSACPALPPLFRGRACFFSARHSEQLNSWLSAAGLMPDLLSTGGTVAVSAMDLARLLGCRRVALCGVDLAMAADGSSHSSASVYAGRKEADLVMVEGNWQPEVKTTRQFANYIAMVSNYIFDLKRRYGVEAFNVSDGGAKIANAALLRPEGLKSLAAASPEAGSAKLAQALKTSRLPGASEASATMRAAAKWLEDCAAEASKLSVGSGAGDLEKLSSLLTSKSGGATLLDSILTAKFRASGMETALDGQKLYRSIAESASAIAKTLSASLAAVEEGRKLKLHERGQATIPPFVAAHSSESILAGLSKAVAVRSEAPQEGGLLLLGENGAMMSLHSRRDPQGEASRQVDGWLGKLNGRPLRFVAAIGLGEGWHLLELAGRMAPNSTLFIADPTPGAFLTAAQRFDFSQLARSGLAVRFAVSCSPDEIAKELSAALDAQGLAAFPSIFEHPGCWRAFPEAYAKLEKAFSTLGRQRLAEIRTNSSLSAEWLLNAIDNLPLAFQRGSIEALRGKLAGGSAIVVAAGPSLDDSIEWLKKASERNCVICVGTALKSLLASGICPDFAMIVDSDPRISAQFDGVDSSLPFKLLAPLQAQPELLSSFKESLLLFSTPQLPGFNAFLRSCGILPPELKTGGTVALTAIDFAHFLGARQIFLAGLDLAVGPDLRSHSTGSVYSGLTVEERRLVLVPGSAGGRVLTTPQFANYVGLLDSCISALTDDGIEVCNLSKSGAAFKGAPLTSESKAGRFLSSSWRREDVLNGFAFDKPLKSNILNAVEALGASLLATSRLASEALSLSEKLNWEKNSGAILARMEAIDKAVNSESLSYGLCDDALKALSLSMASGGDADELAATRGIFVYEALAKASAHLAERLSKASRAISSSAD